MFSLATPTVENHFQAVIEQMQGMMGFVEDALASDAVELGVEIARQLLKIEIAAENYDLEGIVRATLAASDIKRGHCVVHIHPDDAARLHLDPDNRPGLFLHGDNADVGIALLLDEDALLLDTCPPFATTSSTYAQTVSNNACSFVMETCSASCSFVGVEGSLLCSTSLFPLVSSSSSPPPEPPVVAVIILCRQIASGSDAVNSTAISWKRFPTASPPNVTG